MRLNESQILKAVLPLVLSPRAIPSNAELARRARISDDTLGRFTERFEREHGFALFAMENGRLTVTERGRRAFQLYSEIWALGDAEDCAKQSMKLQVESILGGLVSAALVPVFDLWGSTISRPSILRLENTIRQDIKEGKGVDLGLGFADEEEAVSDDEALGSVEWCALVPVGHSLLGESQGPLPLEQLPKGEWLLLPDLAFGTNGLADSFVRAGHKQVMECNHLAQYVAAGVGVAVLPNVHGNRCPQGTVIRRLVGLPSISVRLFLPRSSATLSSPNEALVEHLRRLVRDGFLSGADNGTTSSTSASRSNQESPDAEDSLVLEPPTEESAMPMAEVLS